MIIRRFAPTKVHDYKLIDRLFENLAMLAYGGMNILKRGEVFGVEFYASHKEAYYTFLLPDGHQDHLFESLQYTFKGAGFSDSPRPLPGPSDTFYTLGVKHHPFCPFKLKPVGELWNRLLITLDTLKEEEEIFIQILLEPLQDDWHDDYRAVYRDYLETGNSMGGVGMKRLLANGIRALADAPKKAFQGESDSPGGAKLKETDTKISQSGMRTCLRIATRSGRPTPLGHSILAAFRTMNAENEWQLEDVLRRKAFIRDWESAAFSRMGAPILCLDELRMFFQMPTEPSTKLSRMTPEEIKTDKRVTKSGILIGHTYSFNKEGEPVYYVTDPIDDFVRGRLVIAPPGGGKTTQIEMFWRQLASVGAGGALWDVADGKLFREAAAYVKEEHAKRCVMIDHTNEKYPPVFNFNALAGAGDDASQMFAELFDVLFQGENLTKSKNLMLKASASVFAFPESQFLEFTLMLRDEDYRKQIIPRLKAVNPDLYLWWMREFPRISDQELNRMTAPILERCDQLFYNPRLKCMMNGRGGAQRPRKWMDEGMLVHYNVSGGRFSEHEQRIVMAMYNQSYWSATLSREDLTCRDIRPRPFFLIYDEPQTYINATPMFRRAISKARKYSTSCNFFIQDAAQIASQSPALWQEILGMKPHIMLGHAGEASAKALASEFRPQSMENLLDIEQYEHTWWLKTYADKKAVAPIIVKTLDPGNFNTRDIRDDLARSRLQYAGRTIEDLSEDISARNMRMTREEYRQAINSYEVEAEEGVRWDHFDGDEMKGRK